MNFQGFLKFSRFFKNLEKNIEFQFSERWFLDPFWISMIFLLNFVCLDLSITLTIGFSPPFSSFLLSPFPFFFFLFFSPFFFLLSASLFVAFRYFTVGAPSARIFQGFSSRFIFFNVFFIEFAPKQKPWNQGFFPWKKRYAQDSRISVMN